MSYSEGCFSEEIVASDQSWHTLVSMFNEIRNLIRNENFSNFFCKPINLVTPESRVSDFLIDLLFISVRFTFNFC